MYIYKKIDGRSLCSVHAHNRKDPIPEGWTELPKLMSPDLVREVDGVLTNEPNPDREARIIADMEIREKIEKEKTRLAIKELKKRGEIPHDYEG
jgi:hypothetical protein